MKYFFALCCFLATAMLFPGLSGAEWLTDFEKAKAESLKTKRPIFILFTNSDAAPCLSLDRTIFSQKKFLDYADRKLVLMKADFPAAIHLQAKAVKQQNQMLKEKYGIAVYPTVLLLDSNGDIYIDFVKADGSQEKHRRKMNEILGFDPPKRYSDYLDGFVKKYTPPKPVEEAKPAAKTETKAPARKPARKPAKKQDEKPQNAQEETTIPDENGGIPLVPIDPEGNFQEWLKANSAEEAAEPAKEIEEAKETVEEEKEAIEAKEDAASQDAEATATQNAETKEDAATQDAETK